MMKYSTCAETVFMLKWWLIDHSVPKVEEKDEIENKTFSTIERKIIKENKEI